MKKQKGFTAIAFILGVLIVAVGIIGGSLYLKSTHPNFLDKVNPLKKVEQSTDNVIQNIQNPTQEKEQNLIVSQNKFGFKIFQQLTQTETNQNLFISPSSIALALLMTYNGAGGTTKEAMSKVLEVNNMSLDEINNASLNLINSFKNPDPKIEIDIANSIWARQGLNFNKSFVDINQKYFQAQTATLDFDNPSAVNTINAWVNTNTKGKIPTIIDPPIPPDIKMYLINAIYFKGAWDIAFDQKQTQDRQFTNYNSTKKMTPMMQQLQKDFLYLENDDFQAVSLPYGKNNSTSMYVFLPKEGSTLAKKDFNTFTQTLNQQNWDTWMGKFEKMEGTVILPKFKVEYKKELKDTLTALGMGIAFNNSANFEGIFHQAVISQVLHKTYIDVNEEGTEAAAVTEVGMISIAAYGVPQKKTFYMEVNRPFFYAIRDNKSGLILFMGTIQSF